MKKNLRRKLFAQKYAKKKDYRNLDWFKMKEKSVFKKLMISILYKSSLLKMYFLCLAVYVFAAQMNQEQLLKKQKL